LVSTLFLLDGKLTRIEGLIFFAGLIVYIVVGYKLSKTHSNEIVPSTEVDAIKPMNFGVSAILIIGGLLMLVYGRQFIC
jgi:Ca2+/Na+ antiporter